MQRIGSIKHVYENGQMQVVDDDVLNIVRHMREISPRLTCYWNDHLNAFTITETSLDGAEERLVFNVRELDERVVDRLRQADQWRGREDPAHLLSADEDFLTAHERAQARIDQAKDEYQRGVMQEPIEAIASYMELDGQGTKASILIPRDLDA